MVILRFKFTLGYVVGNGQATAANVHLEILEQDRMLILEVGWNYGPLDGCLIHWGAKRNANDSPLVHLALNLFMVLLLASNTQALNWPL